MRKLAHIEKIINLRPIEGADLIEVADVLGWSVVVKKNDFKIGDMCVYFEIDAFINGVDPRFNNDTFRPRFINWNGMEGLRVKTIRLRKQLSQGLVLPVTQFPEIKNPQEGDDVTDLLKVHKWESAAELQSNGSASGSSGNSKLTGIRRFMPRWLRKMFPRKIGTSNVEGSAPFPKFIRRTDQERVQNYIGELSKHADETWEETIKLDGSSTTFFTINMWSEFFKEYHERIEERMLSNLKWFDRIKYLIKKQLGKIETPYSYEGLCSRNLQLDIGASNHFSEFARKNGILERLKESAYGNIAIQGELIGPAIQDNFEKVDDFQFYVYDVYDIEAQKYMLPADARYLAEQLGLSYVPVLNDEAKLSDFGLAEGVEMRTVVDNILARAEGQSLNKNVRREGVVYKSNQSEFSFKAVANSYLLAKEKKMEKTNAAAN